MSKAIRQLLLLIIALLGTIHINGLQAREALPEYTLKVGFLYNFAILTEWPDYALMNDRINICFIADEDFRTALDSIRYKQIKNRQISIRPLHNSESAKDCNIIYIAETSRYDNEKIMRQASQQPILTVTDDAQLAKMGAVIYLRPEGQRLVFEIDSKLAQNIKLNISSRLLRLSR